MERMRVLHTEIEREIAQKIRRCQRLAEERNVLLAKRKAARARANEHTIRRIDEGPPDFSALAECLRSNNQDGAFADAILERILAIPEESVFMPAKKTCAAANAPPGKGVATSNSWRAFAENPSSPLPLTMTLQATKVEPLAQRGPRSLVQPISGICRSGQGDGGEMQGVYAHTKGILRSPLHRPQRSADLGSGGGIPRSHVPLSLPRRLRGFPVSGP